MEKIGEAIGKLVVIVVAIAMFLLLLGITLIILGFVGLGIQSIWRMLF